MLSRNTNKRFPTYGAEKPYRPKPTFVSGPHWLGTYYRPRYITRTFARALTLKMRFSGFWIPGNIKSWHCWFADRRFQNDLES